MEQRMKSVEQYKQEMLSQARRGGMQAAVPAAKAAAQAAVRADIKAAAQAEVKIAAPQPPAPAEHVCKILGHTQQAAQAALYSDPDCAIDAAAAKGIELGPEAPEPRIEHEHLPPVQSPLPPPPVQPVVGINFNQNVEQTAPAVTAPTVTAAAIAAPAIPAPPPEAVPLPIISPVAPPSPPCAQIQPILPVRPAPKPAVPPPSRPVPLPMQPDCDPAPCAMHPAPARTPASCRKRPAHPAHKPYPQPCARTGGKPQPRLKANPAWYEQPAVEACYADDDAMFAFSAPQAEPICAVPAVEACTAGDDAMFAFSAPQAEPAGEVPPVVAYASVDGQQTDAGYYKLPMPKHSSLEDYLAYNKSRGTIELQVRVASDEGAPIPGAQVDILQIINGVTYLFFHGETDENGSTGRIALPAPDKSLTYKPPQGFVPYAAYTVTASHGSYAPKVYENVTIFPEAEAVQVVRMGAEDEPAVIDEGVYVL